MLFHEAFSASDALNIGKVGTGVVILVLAGKYGFGGNLQNHNITNTVLYTGIHLSYLSWWLLEQYLFPPFWDKRFNAPVEPAAAITMILLFGILYALPAYNAFTRPTVLSPAKTIACVMLFTLGSLINAMADVQMHAMKMALPDKKILVTEGIFRLAQNPNFFGDYLRYAAIGVSSGGHWSSFIPLALGMLVNWSSTKNPKAQGGMRDRYGAEVYDEWITNVPNKVIPSVSSEVAIVMATVLLIWAASFGIGYMTRGSAKKIDKKKKKI